MSTPEIEHGLRAADEAAARVLATLAGLTDQQARAPSRLPGWSRGHVVTHLARNADGVRNMVEGALADEPREQYPGGFERRAAEIEAGAHRDAATLIADFAGSHRALTDAWHRIPAGAWSRPGIWLVTGPQPVQTTLLRRRRELLVHWVDLDLGASPFDLPDDYLTEDFDWLRENRTTETWPDAPW
jgi:maleylpyruvate isomerase